MPDDLLRSLADIAVAQHKSLQKLAVERLRSLVEGHTGRSRGLPDRPVASHAATTRPIVSDVDEFDAAIAARRFRVQSRVVTCTIARGEILFGFGRMAAYKQSSRRLRRIEDFGVRRAWFARS